MKIIVRVCFNRPEMFKLSLDYEIAARKYFDIGEDLHTIFVVEYGSPDKILELIDDYPYSKSIIKRSFKFGLSKNILESLKIAFQFTEDWLIYIEDDILVHKTYFQYMKAVLDMKELSNFSVISAYNFDDKGSVNEVRKDRHYAALAPLISKKFHQKYILPCSNDSYYNNPAKFVCELNDLYKDYQHDRTYRYTDSVHNQQAGTINRLNDISRIEDNTYVVMPSVNYIVHAGFTGHNRPGGVLNGNTFEERLEDLKVLIQDADLMYERSATKQYNDYKVFSPKLDDWDGTLELTDKYPLS